MADPWHVAWLKEGVKPWNERRKKVDFRPDLSGVTFFQCLPERVRDNPKTTRFFEGIDLSGSNLSRADLSGLNFQGGKLAGANLEDASLDGSNFRRAKFIDANLRGASAIRTDFHDAHFEDSPLTSTKLEGALFDHVTLISSEVDDNQVSAMASSDGLDKYKSLSEYRAEKVVGTPLYDDGGRSIARVKLPEARKPRDPKYDVFYATNRVPIFERGHLVDFGNSRVDDTHFGICEVAIPKSHKIGKIGSGLWKKITRQDDENLRLVRIIGLNGKLYWEHLQRLSDLQSEKEVSTIFVHGYNTSFKEAVLRAAQIGYDLGIGRGIGLFSWPSVGSPFSYAVDETANEESKYRLADFIIDFSNNLEHGKVNIIAHSMGCRCLMGALENLALKGSPALSKVNHVILAAADIDTGVMNRIAKPALDSVSSATSYVAQKDVALMISAWLHRYNRIGVTPPTYILDGVDTVLVNNFNLGQFGHGYVASSRIVLNDIFSILKNGLSPDKRHSLESVSDSVGNYWRLKE